MNAKQLIEAVEKLWAMTDMTRDDVKAAIEEVTAPLQARIAELEGLGPLIEEYGSASWNDGCNAAEGQRRTSARGDVKAKIDAILKGGAS